MSYPASVKEGKDFNYNFWNNKPVMDFNEYSANLTAIENLKERPVYKNNDELPIPVSLEWKTFDINNNTDLELIVDFLNKNYYMNKTNRFSAKYSPEYIKWSLGDNPLLVGIIRKTTQQLCGFISASFRNMVVFDKVKKVANVKYLCSDPVFRKKKIAFVLIDELTRRVVKMGLDMGCFITARCVPSPITTLRYYHRPLNYEKLHKHKFVHLEGDAKMRHKKFQIKENLEDCVKLTEENVEQAYYLYTQFMDKYNIYMKYDLTEFKNVFISNITESYIVWKDGKAQDFFSYYKLPYSISNSNEIINAGYLLTYTAMNTSDNDMIVNSVISASENNLDVFNVLDNMGVASSIMAKDYNYGEDSDGEDYDKMYDNRFLKGSAKLHFYFFNWKCPRVIPCQMAYQVY